MKEQPTNGRARKEKLFLLISERVKTPTTLSTVFKQAKRRKDFDNLTASTFYYNVKQLQLDGKIFLSESRDFHPKRKPVILINPVNKTTDEKRTTTTTN